jgi:peptidoglycan/xylan/chitin deacetylase (PgdA/CDA1 family)
VAQLASRQLSKKAVKESGLPEDPPVISMNMFRSIPKKREYLARAFRQLGIIGLLERVASVRGAGLVVLTYHRIAEPSLDRFYEPVISATPESFRAQVRWLHHHIRLLTLNELLAQVETGLSWGGLAVLLTFDDGYRDNFDIAVPILQECDVPATFFIPTAFVESPRLPWWDQVAYVIKETHVRQFTLEYKTSGRASSLFIDLETMPRTSAIMTIIRAFLHETVADQAWFLEQLSMQAEVAVDHNSLGRALFMTWEQVRQLASLGKGLTIGSHSHSHHKLAKLDDDSQRHELAGSKRILETRINQEVAALAYPFGWPGTYTVRTKMLAIEAGYRLAFASREGVNWPRRLDRFEVCRLVVGLGDSPALLQSRTALHAMFGASFL